MFSREWRCSWSSADRRCSNNIWEIDNFIAYLGASYIRGFMVIPIMNELLHVLDASFEPRTQESQRHCRHPLLALPEGKTPFNVWAWSVPVADTTFLFEIISIWPYKHSNTVLYVLTDIFSARIASTGYRNSKVIVLHIIPKLTSYRITMPDTV